MASRIPAEFIDELITRTDIVEVINRRVPLRKAGKDYQACCPFHDEKTPSFTVSPDKQFYHCFGCGAHGTAIGFLMDFEHQEFRDAVEELARAAGLPVPNEDESAPKGPDTRPLYALLEKAAQLYQRELRQHPEAVRAVDYLKGRGLSGQIAAGFGLGYAPPVWDFLIGRLGRTEQDLRHLIQAGLVVEQDGKHYDRFRDRILFPIRDRRGRVIGFGGRLLGDGKPKYLNSPETPLFHKGRELYGLHQALKAQRTPQRLLVVEGYMDVIALAQFGIDYAVATLGTATTPDHLRHLLPQTPELIFCFDGDQAGRNAAWKALETCLPLATGQQEIRFLFLPEGEDPDTLIRQEGRAAFEERLQQAKTLSDFLLDHLATGIDLNTLDGRARLGTRVTPLLERLPAGLLRDLLRDRLSKLVGLALPNLPPPPSRRALGHRRPSPPPTTRHQAATPLRLAIAILVQYPELASVLSDLDEDWRQLNSPGIPLLADLLGTLARHPGLGSAALLERWREMEGFPFLRRLADPGLLAHVPPDGLAPELAGAIQRLNHEAVAARSSTLFNRASTAEWTEEEKDALRLAIQSSRTGSSVL
ncbi:MAG: DNA primase [Gammaproteobacteria bacterium]|jgi:DNA primase|nr:DNA primase [Gammaproteobacteria bacterium]